MPNNRIYYAVQQIGFAKIGTQSFIAAHGVQSVGITTNYNLEQFFELGNQAIYHNAEQIPDVEVNVQKILDGYPLLYHLATNGAASTGGTLAGRSNLQTIFGMSIFNDTQLSASGTPISQLQCSGMFISSASYNFNVEGAFTEDISLVGTTKVWSTAGPFAFSGAFVGNNDTPLALASGWGGVQRRQNLVWAAGSTSLDANSQTNFSPTVMGTTLPPDIPGISSSGTNDLTGGVYGTHVQRIAVSVNLGRTPLYELGRKSYYFRYVEFPVQVTCDIDVLDITGDRKSCTEDGINADGTNLTERTIKIATTEGTFIDLGTHNKLQTITTQGGDATGGNVTTSYQYITYNDFYVRHKQDPSGSNL